MEQAGKILLVANTDWYLCHFRLSMARFLQSQGFEVGMVAPAGLYAEEITKSGFRFIEWPLGRRTMSPWSETSAITRIVDIYRTEKPLLVHHFTIKPVLYGSLAARISHVPYVVNSVTGLGYIFLKKGWQGQLFRAAVLPFYHLAFSHPHLEVIFENKNDQDTFVHYRLIGSKDGTIINGVGVDAQRFSPVDEPDPQTLVVVFPARMLIDKGLKTVVDAARILHVKQAQSNLLNQENAQVRIALVGEPDPGNPATVSEEALRAWEKEGLVEWWGFQRDMQRVYQNCHIVTLPSFGEGLPTALIEAAACARPIVTTDVPGCRDVVTHNLNGLLVPPNDPQALAQALEGLIADASLRARMGAAGRQMVLERFTDQKVNQATLAVYQQIMSASSEKLRVP